MTSTERTEGAVLTGLIIIDEADLLIPHSQGTPLHKGPRDKRLNLLIPLKELPCPLGEAQGLGHEADLRAQTLLAVVAAQEVAVNQIAAQVMGLGLVQFSPLLHMPLLLLPLLFLTQMSRAGALELKYRICQSDPQTPV